MLLLCDQSELSLLSTRGHLDAFGQYLYALVLHKRGTEQASTQARGLLVESGEQRQTTQAGRACADASHVCVPCDH